MGFVLVEEETEDSPTGKFELVEEEKVPRREEIIKSSEPVEEFGQQYGKGFGGEVLASPRTFSELLSYGSKFMAQKGEEQAIKKGTPLSGADKKVTQNILKGMDFPLKILNKIGYPTKERFEEMIDTYSEFTGQQTEKEPQSAAGRYGKTLGEFSAFAVPGKGATLPARLAFSLLGGAGSQTAEELGLGEGSQLAASIGVPIAAHLVQSILSGKFTPSSSEMKKLGEFFRKKGMNETEITTLLQPKAKVGTLGKLAKGDATRGILKTDVPEILKGIEKKLGSSYGSLKEQAANLPEASRKSLGNVLDKFQNVIDGIDTSHMAGPDKLAARKLIDEGIHSIAANGLSAESIMATYQDINRAVNWKSYQGGKKDLAKLQKPLKQALMEIDPLVGQNFEKLNEGWARMKNLQKKLSPNKFKTFLNYGKTAGLIGGIVKGALSGEWMVPTGILGTELTERIATKMLTDPKYQNLALKMASAINVGSKASGVKAFKEFADQAIDDFPEESREVDWKSILEE